MSGAAAAAPLKSRFSDAQGMFHFLARISVASLHASRNGAFSLEDRWRKCRACRRWRRSRSVVRRAETDDVDGLTDEEGPPACPRRRPYAYAHRHNELSSGRVECQPAVRRQKSRNLIEGDADVLWTAHESLSPLKSGSENRADGGTEGGREDAHQPLLRMRVK